VHGSFIVPGTLHLGSAGQARGDPIEFGRPVLTGKFVFLRRQLSLLSEEHLGAAVAEVG
jgi:hypothetical protein